MFGRQSGNWYEWEQALRARYLVCLYRILGLKTDSSHGSQKLGDADEVIGGRGQDEEPFDQLAPTMACLAQAANRLDPSERLFDPLSLDRAEAITRVAGGATVDRRATVGVILRDVRRAAAFAAAGDEIGRVIVFVAANRAAWLGVVLDHFQGGGPLGRAVGLGQAGIHDETIAVFHHQDASA